MSTENPNAQPEAFLNGKDPEETLATFTEAQSAYDTAKARLSELEGRLETTNKQVVSVREERRALAVSASQGDQEATARIGQLASEQFSLESQVTTLGDAFEATKASLKQAGDDLRKADAEHRLAQALHMARQILGVSSSIDERLQQLGSLLEERDKLYNQIVVGGSLEAYQWQRARDIAVLGRALALNKVPLGDAYRGSPNSVRSSDASILGSIRLPESKLAVTTLPPGFREPGTETPNYDVEKYGADKPMFRRDPLTGTVIKNENGYDNSEEFFAVPEEERDLHGYVMPRGREIAVEPED